MYSTVLKLRGLKNSVLIQHSSESLTHPGIHPQLYSITFKFPHNLDFWNNTLSVQKCLNLSQCSAQSWVEHSVSDQVILTHYTWDGNHLKTSIEKRLKVWIQIFKNEQVCVGFHLCGSSCIIVYECMRACGTLGMYLEFCMVLLGKKCSLTWQ